MLLLPPSTILINVVILAILVVVEAQQPPPQSSLLLPQVHGLPQPTPVTSPLQFSFTDREAQLQPPLPPPTKPPMVQLTRTTAAQSEFISTPSFIPPTNIITIDVGQTPAPVTSAPQSASPATQQQPTKPPPSPPQIQELPSEVVISANSPATAIQQHHRVANISQPQESSTTVTTSLNISTASTAASTTTTPFQLSSRSNDNANSSTNTMTTISVAATSTTTTPAPFELISTSTVIPSTPIRALQQSSRAQESRRLTDNNPTSPSVQFLKPKSKFKCSAPSDCLNGGLCFNGNCFCPPGFTGESCAINIDECRQVEEPCFNNGTCIDEVNQFRCDCVPGFKGDRCQETVDMCAASPCLNGAKCINHRTSFFCECEPGWEGEQCNKNIDECLRNPCQNGGICHDLVNDYQCDCGSSGFTSKNCDVNFDDCEVKPCSYYGAKECIDLTGDHKCVCHDGFTGKNCELDIQECLTNPCENNGTCTEKSANLPPLLKSPLDQTIYHDIRDQNLSSSSVNISQYAGYICECKEEYYGDRCEEKKKCYTKSVVELCNHPHAECVNVGSSYECLINASFDGTDNYATYRVNGEFKVREIHVKYKSLTGGTIMIFETTQADLPIADLHLNKSGLYLSGVPINRHENIKFDELLDGSEREIKIELDSPTEIKMITLGSRQNDYHSPFKGCLTQVRLNNQLVPLVDYGFGMNHTFELNYNNLALGQCRTCFEKDCMNHGHCTHEFQEGYDHCVCPDTFTGNFCEIDVNECEKTNLCMNGGTCENLHGGHRCNCKEGFRGEKCQDISDYCKAKQPCVTGTCKNINPAQLTWQCECPSSHLGKRCERKRDCINECHQHHAQCINNVTCACLPGRREERMMCEYVASCEQVEGDLCLNGGTCKNLETGGYHCVCQEPFYGPICQFLIEKPQFDVILLIVVTCVGFLMAACAVVSLVIFRSVRKARATRGTYSPSTQEKFGNSASDLLKPPQPERLI